MNRDRKLYVAPKMERVHFAFEGVCITASPGIRMTRALTIKEIPILTMILGMAAIGTNALRFAANIYLGDV